MAVKIIKPSCHDTYISSNHDSPFDFMMPFQKSELIVGKDKKVYRSLLKFDISSLQANITILSASLCLFLSKNNNPSVPKSLTVYEIISDWCECSVCWCNQPLYSLNPVSSLVITGELGTYLSWSITKLVQDWYTGTVVNNGVLLKADNELSSNIVRFRSRKNKKSEVWPYLSVEYFLPACNVSAGTIDKIYSNLQTADNYIYTESIDVLSFNYSYVVVNKGSCTAQVKLQVSPSSINWYDDSLNIDVAPGETSFITPNNMSRFARMAYKSKEPGQITSLDIYIQGRTI